MTIKCPHCEAGLDPAFIHWAAAALTGFSSLKGEAKARSPELARRAARARWDKLKAAKVDKSKRLTK